MTHRSGGSGSGSGSSRWWWRREQLRAKLLLVHFAHGVAGYGRHQAQLAGKLVGRQALPAPPPQLLESQRAVAVAAAAAASVCCILLLLLLLLLQSHHGHDALQREEGFGPSMHWMEDGALQGPLPAAGTSYP